MEQTAHAGHEQTNYAVRHVDFAHPESCAYTNPLECVVDGHALHWADWNWRDALIAVTEYFLKINEGRVASFAFQSGRPFMTEQKPNNAECRQLTNKKYVVVGYDLPRLVSMIGKLCVHCGVGLDNVKITYTPKGAVALDTLNSMASEPQPAKGSLAPTAPEISPLLAILVSSYPNGFTFEATAIRLLSDKSGVSIDDEIVSVLKRAMFRRRDGVYFLPDVVADAKTRDEMVSLADTFLDDHGCFELSELYALFTDRLNKKCIDGLEDFETFYGFISRRDVRYLTKYSTRIVRVQHKNISSLSYDIAAKLVAITHDEYRGVINEDDLRNCFPGFSVKMIASVLKDHAEELVKTKINGIVHYQTLDALGLPDGFSSILAETLSQLDELDIAPSEEVLHAALSIRLGVNFKAEYNIQESKIFRRLIAYHYNHAPEREWKSDIFAEAPN